MVVRKKPDKVDVKHVKRKRNPAANIKAKKFHHELILDKAASLYLQGKTMRDIGQAFNPPVTAMAVSRWMAEVRERWHKSSLMDFNERKSQELAKIDKLEAVAYEAWERSVKDAETRKKVITKALRKSDDDEEGTLKIVGTVNDKTAKGQSGNPAFLAQVERCIEMRCRIFGISKAPDVTLNQTNNTMNVVAPSWDALFALPEPPDPVVAKLQEVERLPALREAVLVENRN